MRNSTTKIDVKRLTYLAIFTALIFVLQLLSFFMRGPVFSLTFVLVPIVIAVALCGVAAGPWLGFIFGVAVLVSGDAALFLTFDPFGTVVTVLLKGTLAGLFAAIVYKALENKNRYLAVIAAAIVCPIVNTGIFLIGCFLFFTKFLAETAQAMGFGDNVAKFILFGLVGFNFLIELGINVVLSPIVVRILNIKIRN